MEGREEAGQRGGAGKDFVRPNVSGAIYTNNGSTEIAQTLVSVDPCVDTKLAYSLNTRGDITSWKPNRKKDHMLNNIWSHFLYLILFYELEVGLLVLCAESVVAQSLTKPTVKIQNNSSKGRKEQQ